MAETAASIGLEETPDGATAMRAWASCLTPFAADGALDVPDLRAHCRRLATHDVALYVGGAGSGEGFTLMREELETVLTTAVDEMRGDVPVRAMGVEPRTAIEMIELCRLAGACGVEAVQVYPLVPGHSTVLREDEILRYYDAVLQAAEVPVVVALHYASGSVVPLPSLLRLINEYDGIVGINYAYGDLRYLTELMMRLPRPLDVVIGGVSHILNGAALGCGGFLVAECNLAPALCAALAARLTAGDEGGAHTAYRRLLELHCSLAAAEPVTAIKHVLRAWGLPGGHCRPPRYPLPDDEGAALVSAVERVLGGAGAAG